MAFSCQYFRKIASWPILGGTLGIPEPKSVGKHTILAKPIPQAVALAQYSRKIASWPILGGTLGIPEPKSVGKHTILAKPIPQAMALAQYSRKIASWPILGGTLGIPEPKSVGKHTILAKPIPQAVALAQYSRKIASWPILGGTLGIPEPQHVGNKFSLKKPKALAKCFVSSNQCQTWVRTTPDLTTTQLTKIQLSWQEVHPAAFPGMILPSLSSPSSPLELPSCCALPSRQHSNFAIQGERRGKREKRRRRSGPNTRRPHKM